MQIKQGLKNKKTLSEKDTLIYSTTATCSEQLISHQQT